MMKCLIDNNQNDKGKKLIKSTTDIQHGDIKFITSIIDFYGKISDVNNAINIFNNVPEKSRNIVTINAMIII